MAECLDTTDRRIIRILQRDGRTPNVEIARQVGISEATVRKRLERLVSEGIIRVQAVPDPAKIGLPTINFLTLDVDLAQLNRIADELIQLPEVRAIHYTSGASDLLIEAWFPSSEDLLRFLTRHIASIPGINHISTAHVLRTLKDSHEWLLPPDSPPHVLIVDDDPDFCEITRTTLAANGYETTTVSNGPEALAQMRVLKPDLVILDMMMSGVLDGLQTGREMRKDEDLRSIPILMVSSITGSDFAKLLPQSNDLPADNFLVKPVKPAHLLSETRRLVRSR
ncbi:MAG: response regulator [Anaerolineae bacterium]|jgi:Lrp/AsnC family transcriptional regulator for asnA, asnC and gidA